MTKAKAIALLNEMHSHCILRSATDAYDDALRDQKGEALMMAIEALSKPTVGGWIPVTERMPEEKCIVLVTTGNTDEMSAFRWRGLWYCFGEGSDVMHNNPIAWLPLPEPFHAERSKQ